MERQKIDNSNKLERIIIGIMEALGMKYLSLLEELGKMWRTGGHSWANSWGREGIFQMNMGIE